MSNMMLSICVPTYNHEKYIEKALKSILMQKTKYSYEVLIGDDLSKDRTRNILREYEKKNPNTFYVYYREHNMNNQCPNNGLDLLLRAKGKYVIMLEGDDFWTDETKIERQINFLEEHSEYLAIAHNCIVVGGDSLPNGEKYPECQELEYTIKHFMSDILPGQLATVMYRNFYLDKSLDISLISKGLWPGDRLLYFFLITNGRIYCEQHIMSAYRHITDSGTSYSANYQYNYKKSCEYYLEILKYSYKINDCNVIKCAEILFVSCLIYGYKIRQCNKKELLQNMKYIKHRYKAVYFYLIYKFNKNILCSKFWI